MLREEVEKINRCQKLIINSDKTGNEYEVEKEQYKRMMLREIAAGWKRVRGGKEEAINEINKEATDFFVKVTLFTT